MYQQAAELLKHPHLQPYVLQVNLKCGSSRTMLPLHHANFDHNLKIRFKDDKTNPIYKDGKRISLGDEMIYKLSDTAEQKSLTSTRTIRDFPKYQNRRIKNLSVGSSQIGEIGIEKTMNGKHTRMVKTIKHSPARISRTPKVQVETSKTFRTRPKHEPVWP